MNRETTAAAAGTGAEPTRRPVRVAVVTALPEELPKFPDALKSAPLASAALGSAALASARRPSQTAVFGDVQEITVKVLPQGQTIAVMATGAGKVAAATGMTKLLYAVEPEWIVCGGIAGSVNSTLLPGTVTIGESCRYYDRDATVVKLPLGAVAPGRPVVFSLPTGRDVAVKLDLPSVRIATGDSVVTSRLLQAMPRHWQKCIIRDSDLVDMESAVCAEVAQTLGYEPVVCRTVFDMVGDAATPAATATGTGTEKIRFPEACRIAAEGIDRVVRHLISSQPY
ncbi:MAG: hypothetical protein WCY01_05470 [Alkalispirochaeta sp.]